MILCFRNPYFYFRHGESTSTASQKSKDLDKVSLLLQDLDCYPTLILDIFLPFQEAHVSKVQQFSFEELC